MSATAPERPPADDVKTVFLTINRAVNVRDILRGGILTTLRESGHRIVILTPAYRDPEFLKEFAAENVIIEPLVLHKPGALERKMQMWRFSLFPELSETSQLLATPFGGRSLGKRAFVLAAMAMKRLLGPARTRRLMMWATVRFFPDRYHREVFERYQPDLVVLTEVFSLAPDSWILKRAIRLGIPTLWLVRSWDNLVTKGILPALPDRVVVWSEMMKDEAVTLHGYAPEDVYVSGPPHLDVMTSADGRPTREEFFRRIGADPAKHLITYAMAPLTRSDLEQEEVVVEHLWRLAETGGFARPSQLLVRSYPLRASSVPPAFSRLPGLLTDEPGRPSSVFPDRDIRVEDLRHLAATLRYSSVVVNVASTITLEAAACETPAVCVAFAVMPDRPYHQSPVKYFDFTHYKKLQACNGVRLARSMDDLVAAINAYLIDRSLDREGRERIITTMYSRLDGHAGERVGRYILQYLADVGRRRQGKRPSPSRSKAA